MILPPNHAARCQVLLRGSVRQPTILRRGHHDDYRHHHRCREELDRDAGRRAAVGGARRVHRRVRRRRAGELDLLAADRLHRRGRREAGVAGRPVHRLRAVHRHARGAHGQLRAGGPGSPRRRGGPHRRSGGCRFGHRRTRRTARRGQLRRGQHGVQRLGSGESRPDYRHQAEEPGEQWTSRENR